MSAPSRESAPRWRWRATGWVIYDDGSRNMVALDRLADDGNSAVETLDALIAAIDNETTWDLDRVVIELRSYDAAQYSEQRSNAAPTPGATAPSERRQRPT